MRAARLVIAALVGMALALAPASAGLAMASATQPQTVEMIVEMIPATAHHAAMHASAFDDDCSCCDPSQDVPAAVCFLKCCCMAAILVSAQPWTGLRASSHADTIAAALSPFSRQPDPPPPRP
jgi:hypothetical protein